MNNHKYFFLGTLISGIFASAITFASEAQAQSNNCPAKPNVGYRCYQDRTLHARSGYPGEDTQGWTYSPPPGYQLMDYQEVVQSRFGEGGGVNVNLVRGGTFSQLSSSIASSNRVLADYRGRIESYARFPISGVPITVGGETEVIDRTLRENEQRLQMLSSDYSNVDRVQVSVTVRGRCTRTAPLVGCVDNEGGKYEGYLRFQLEYVGNPADIITANEAALRRAQNSLARLQSASNVRRSEVGLRGIVHLQNIGDVPFQGGAFAGTRGESRRLEGFSIAITDGTPNLGIQYMAHLQNIGDTTWVNAGQFIGTRGESSRLEGFAITLTGSAATNYNIRYICHLQDIGDTPVRSNGEFCGTRGESRRLEGLQVWIERR